MIFALIYWTNPKALEESADYAEAWHWDFFSDQKDGEYAAAHLQELTEGIHDDDEHKSVVYYELWSYDDKACPKAPFIDLVDSGGF